MLPFSQDFPSLLCKKQTPFASIRLQKKHKTPQKQAERKRSTGQVSSDSTIGSEMQTPKKTKKIIYKQKPSRLSEPKKIIYRQKCSQVDESQNEASKQSQNASLQILKSKAQDSKFVHCVVSDLLQADSAFYPSFYWNFFNQALKPTKRLATCQSCQNFASSLAPYCKRCLAIYSYNRTVNLHYFCQKDYDFAAYFWESNFSNAVKMQEDIKEASLDLTYVQKLLE